MAKTMTWNTCRGVIVTVHGASDPADQEWSDYLQFAKSRFQGADRNVAPRVFVYSAGGGPSARQRKVLVDAFPPGDDGPGRVSMVTESALVRSIGIAVSWFNRHLKVFSPTELAPALEHLEVPANQRAEILAELNRLAGSIGVVLQAQLRAG